MRVSVERGSEYYDPRAFEYLAFLNGQQVECYVEADTDEGWVRLMKRRADGSIKFPFEYETLHGEVELKTK